MYKKRMQVFFYVLPNNNDYQTVLFSKHQILHEITSYLKEILYITTGVMKTDNSVYTVLIHTTYLSPSTQVAV